MYFNCSEDNPRREHCSVHYSYCLLPLTRQWSTPCVAKVCRPLTTRKLVKSSTPMAVLTDWSTGYTATSSYLVVWHWAWPSRSWWESCCPWTLWVRSKIRSNYSSTTSSTGWTHGTEAPSCTSSVGQQASLVNRQQWLQLPAPSGEWILDPQATAQREEANSTDSRRQSAQVALIWEECASSPPQLSASFFCILSNLNHLGCFCFVWAQLLEQQQLKKKKNPPANAGHMGLIPGPGRSHIHRAIKPAHHNYWACALEPGSHNYWSPWALKSVLCNKRSRCYEKPMNSNKWVALPTHPTPYSLQLEKVHVALKTQHSQK